MGERSEGRKTATFAAYYWEAYNDIVRPDRFDWYLITRWLPDLGPEGFAVVKALRNLCYFNPRTGQLRDECQITMDELAEACGMKRSTLYRVFDKSEALQSFVQKLPEVIHVEGRTRRLPPRFRVCMDTPIHPGDAERYDLLRAGREVERSQSEEEKRKSQIEIYERRKSQRGGRKSQDQERESQSGITNNELNLLSEGFTKESVPPPAGIPPAKAAPKGGAELSPAALLWNKALLRLQGEVNKPTYEAHFKTLQPVALEEGRLLLRAPSAFTREWIQKRFEEKLSAAASAVYGSPLVVSLVQGEK